MAMIKAVEEHYKLYLQHHAASLGRTPPGDVLIEVKTTEQRFAVALAAFDSRGLGATLKTYGDFASALTAAVPRT